MWNRKVYVRIIEVLLCIACVVALRVTDDESRRVFHYLRNRSREWSLLNNVTWGTIGAALATATCGGYVIVSAGLLVGAASDELRGRKTEFLLLGLGVVLFGIVGSLSLASIDSVPEDLVDNAAVLGALCLLTALVFIVDLLMKPIGGKKKHDATQTLTDKDLAKSGTTALMMMEKDAGTQAKSGKTGRDLENGTKLINGTVNGAFDRSNDLPENQSKHTEREPEREVENSAGRNSQTGTTDIFEEERNRKFENVERQLREYSQNFENSRPFRDSQRYRDHDKSSRSIISRNDYRENDRYRPAEGPPGYYKVQDVYQRPEDEVDTPRFPTNLDKRGEPIFAKIINPGVKIMKVDRDYTDDRFEDYRFQSVRQRADPNTS
ncbi:uncharacterized protein LOC107271473 isoform X2 [Cephus cinctus]|uniref:Uncharacterized protein LOC107271473 isoform X2 n=1 Tax=Cephus cinctus TaxID=211228 RepID=A0AAJ7FQB9_CEPCN|nr:uncharacterized protein LOC107271473 isoform X2 [Cephus cinctus]